MQITEHIRYIGVEDADLDLFESHYQVQEGVTYNSYLLLDEYPTIIDTVDPRKGDEWLDRLQEALQGSQPHYLVISHMEPDHSGNISRLLQRYPDLKLVGNSKTFQMLPLYVENVPAERLITVKEGDTLCLERHTLEFHLAPMVHWPEVMVSFERTEGILFSADAFGTFGLFHSESPWENEARRYYFNICGKYGPSVQMLLKKAAALPIRTICPLHGPLLRSPLDRYLALYDCWSRYEPEEKGVLIACASIHGNTLRAAQALRRMLEERGEKVVVHDLSRGDISAAVADAFRFDRTILAACSYDGSVFPPMADLLHTLQAKQFQHRRVALIENGSWAPCAARKMKEILSAMKDIHIADPVCTLRGTYKPADRPSLEAIAEAMRG
ncbi:MAG: FprA family A-type flavoprotein [Alloprevotella sp.]